MNEYPQDSIKLSKNAITVLEKRYLRKDAKDGNVIETPTDMFRRVANSIAEAEKKFDPDADVAALTERFYKMMVERLCDDTHERIKRQVRLTRRSSRK